MHDVDRDPVAPLARLDARAVAAFRSALPFRHVVLDDLLAPSHLQALAQAIAHEPHWPNRMDIHDFMGSANDLAHPDLQRFHASFGTASALAAVGDLAGAPLSRVEMRSYVYMPGHFLQPHSDWSPATGRRIAYAFYVWTQGCEGGELDLYACTLDQGRIVDQRQAVRIAPRANRLVLFEVGPATVHQVRKVQAGARVSLSGWFY